MGSAKEQYFREAWIMLKKPFKFIEMENPLQQMTILYAYADHPLIKRVLNEKGKEAMETIRNSQNGGFLGGDLKYKKRFMESQESYDERICKEIDYINDHYSTVEVYEGHVVECTVEGVACKFYPDEYSVIGLDTFNMAVSGDEFHLKIEMESLFNIKEIRDKIFYIRQRGIPAEIAKKWASHSLKDAVYFKPRIEVLQYFCRDNQIYLPDTDYPDYIHNSEGYVVEKPVANNKENSKTETSGIS